MGQRNRFSVYLMIAGLLFASPNAWGQVSSPVKRKGAEPKPYPYLMPFWGDKLAERGVDFPLPWGINLNYMFVQQDVEINSIQLGLNGSELVDVSDLIVFDEVKSTAHILNLRLDVFLLPFLSAYGIFAFTPATSTAVSLAEPFALDAASDFTAYGFGGGTTAAFGFQDFWIAADINATRTHIEALDDPITAVVFSPRLGHNFRFDNGMQLGLWAGAMMQLVSGVVEGEVNLSDVVDPAEVSAKVDDALADPDLGPAKRLIIEQVRDQLAERPEKETTVRYRLDKRLADPWNMIVGSQFSFNKTWHLRTEVGFIGRFSTLLSLQYRFGIPIRGE